MNLDDDRPVCDFCDLMIEEDEALEPVYVGEQPTPKAHRLSETAPKDRGRQMQLFGKPASIYMAMYEALRSSEYIEIHESMYVEESTGSVKVGDLEHGKVPSHDMQIKRRDDLVGVSLHIEPREVTQSADAEVCPNCARMFEEL